MCIQVRIQRCMYVLIPIPRFQYGIRYTVYILTAYYRAEQGRIKEFLKGGGGSGIFKLITKKTMGGQDHRKRRSVGIFN